jgi:hypothetical protein
MTRESKKMLSKKEQQKRRDKKREELNKKKKRNSNSDDDSNSSDELSDEYDEGMDVHEFRKYVQKIFPSKHLDKKIKAGEKLKKMAIDEDDSDDSDYVPPKKNKYNKKKKPVVESDSEEDDEAEDDSDEEDDDDVEYYDSKKHSKGKYVKRGGNSKKNKKKRDSSDDEDSESLGSQDTDYDDECDDDECNAKKGSGKVNIIFTIGGAGDDNDDDEWEDYDEDEDEDDDEESEDEDESVSTDESSEEGDESYDEEEEEEDEEYEPRKKTDKNKRREREETKKKKKVDEELKDETEKKGDKNEILEQLKDLLSKNPKDKSIEKCIEVYEGDVKKENRRKEKKEKKQKDKNMRIFKKVLSDKNSMNDFVFYNKLDTDNQKKLIKEVREINKITRIEKPYRMTLLESSIPLTYKAAAMRKVNSLRYMEPGSGEFYKIKNWVDTFMKIPFTNYKDLPLSIEDGVEKCHEFMETAQKTLEEAVHGLNDAKMQIMQMLGQLLTNPKAIGTAIAIHGPMGTGKCMVYDTPILMYDGTVKMVQDVEVGDIVMGDDSTPRNVISLGRGEDDLYEIIPTKGEKYGVNSEHILCLKPSGLNTTKKIINKNGTTSYKAIYFNKNTLSLQSKSFDRLDLAEKYLFEQTTEDDVIEIAVKDLINLPSHIKNNLKGYRTGVEFQEKELPFDPYIIGVWLGDGTSANSGITNQDAVILSYIRNEIKKYNLNLTHQADYSYRISYDMYDNDSRNNKNVFLQVLKDFNLLNNKHIPHIYKINNRQNRLELLAGIIDTDGSYSVKDKCFDIIQKNKNLSDDILFVARSLGYSAYQKECKKSCLYKGEKKEGTYYRICISGNNLSDIPTKCIRKQAVERIQVKNNLKTGISVHHIGWGKYYGFTLDNNHRYLLGDFTVTHNTTLVKEGISKILNRPFAFIALGGATDSSFLEGHGYTYEGSTWGKIVQILIDSQCMNPVIYFDELDKISDTPRGEEIAGILTHLTDTSQNSQFHDKYFAEIDFDLSKCLFIFSYNDESKVNPILRDRMYRIKTKGYSTKEKMVIANNYLLPKIHDQVRFTNEDIIISDDVLGYINETHCNKEDGVRNMKRCLEIIHTKLNLYRLMKPDTNLFEDEMSLKVEFPFVVTKDVVDKLIKKESNSSETWKMLYN